ncbi:MAG: aspartate 1-decarboxylase [Spirochaetales bacterium]|nr:aspartate 1-decarboxylase [Spirochaetales bacterium]
MLVELLKSKLHRATVTDANLEYEGSVSIDRKLYRAAGFFLHEKVDILNLNNGERFTTYVIEGKPGEVCLNGAAARKACPGDPVIIASYAQMSREEAENWEPTVVLLGEGNLIKNPPV